MTTLGQVAGGPARSGSVASVERVTDAAAVEPMGCLSWYGIVTGRKRSRQLLLPSHDFFGAGGVCVLGRGVWETLEEFVCRCGSREVNGSSESKIGGYLIY